jgi:phage pi2 protein 07
VFSVAVPLSISVRTDDQYMTEDAKEWDEQWGRLFGGVGLLGKARITQYYQDNSPFHLLNSENLDRFKDLKIYIDNGDDEQTLSRSNEELHILLRDLNINHEFRVRNGGHTFEYWRSSLKNGLNFIDDAFNQIQYRGDEINMLLDTINNINSNLNLINDIDFDVLLPKDYTTSFRYYPVIYFVGNFENAIRLAMADRINYQTKRGNFPPSISVFFDLKSGISFESIISKAQAKYRIRDGPRFQAIIGFKEGGAKAFQYAVTTNNFTACAVYDAPIDIQIFNSLINKNDINSLKSTWFFISTTDKSQHYKLNGLTHIELKEKEIYHEYRVDEGYADIHWFLNGLPAALDFTQKKIHY